MPKNTHSYDNPKAYSENNSLQYRFAMTVINRLSLKKNARILDVCCGDGRIPVELANIAKEGLVLATDISDEMIRDAGHNYRHQANLKFIKMDASQLLFREQFDLVTSFNGLHWVKDQASALRGIANAVIENGKIALLLSHKKSTYHHALDAVCTQKKWQPFFKDYVNPRSFFTIAEYENLLEEAGLAFQPLIEEEMTYNFDSVEKLKAFFNASMANIKQIPADKKTEFLDDFCKEFLTLSQCNDLTQIKLSFWCLKVFASKPALDQKPKPPSIGTLFRAKL